MINDKVFVQHALSIYNIQSIHIAEHLLHLLPVDHIRCVTQTEVVLILSVS